MSSHATARVAAQIFLKRDETHATASAGGVHFDLVKRVLRDITRVWPRVRFSLACFSAECFGAGRAESQRSHQPNHGHRVPYVQGVYRT
jgi:hypothetical protein